MTEERGAETPRYLTERRLFLIVAVGILVITTDRFDGDMAALLFSLVVVGGVMYFD